MLSLIFVSLLGRAGRGLDHGSVEQKRHRDDLGPRPRAADRRRRRRRHADARARRRRRDRQPDRGLAAHAAARRDFAGSDVERQRRLSEVGFGHCEATLLVRCRPAPPCASIPRRATSRPTALTATSPCTPLRRRARARSAAAWTGQRVGRHRRRAPARPPCARARRVRRRRPRLRGRPDTVDADTSSRRRPDRRPARPRDLNGRRRRSGPGGVRLRRRSRHRSGDTVSRPQGSDMRRA